MGIRFDERRKLFFLESKNTTYQMKIDEMGVLEHVYYGASVGDADMSYRNRRVDRGFSGNPYEQRADRGASLDLAPQEYSGCGVGDYRLSAILTVAENGSRSCDLRYAGHEIRNGKYGIPGLPSVRDPEGGMQTLAISLRDAVTHVAVTLLYSVIWDKDIITRSAVVTNEGDGALRLEKAASAGIDFPYGDFDLIHFYGRHCMERQMERTRLSNDIHVIGSKRGMSSHHHNPFCVLCDPAADEDKGDCYGFMLMYSGSHKIEIERDQAGSARVVMGIQDEHFTWRLQAGASFFAPEAILTFSARGLNGMSQNYHRAIRENVCSMKYRDLQRPVLLNSWEAAYFDFDADKILSLAGQAAELGVELFVLDDGWFENRRDDNAGLGDWTVDEQKLPGGLGRISDAIHALGMKFGIWLEPEMVSEDSALYRRHPDWALRDPDRKPMMSRNQMALDLARGDVVDYLYGRIAAILENARIEYIKWDFNRSVANLYSGLLPAERQGEVAHRFMLGTYALLERLTENFPDVMIEGCAGGGGRFDAGMLYYCPQIWCSDDTDPIARLKIQKGTSYGYPVSAMGSHVSVSPNHQTGRETPLQTRGIVAMSGTFGYELDVNLLGEGEKEEIRRQIQDFHKYYRLIQKGLYYRLTDEEKEAYYYAWEFVSENGDEALLCLVVTDVHANPEFPYVRLRGLQPDAWYELEGEGARFTGAALMYGGYAFEALSGVYPARLRHFVRVSE